MFRLAIKNPKKVPKINGLQKTTIKTSQKSTSFFESRNNCTNLEKIPGFDLELNNYEKTMFWKNDLRNFKKSKVVNRKSYV